MARLSDYAFSITIVVAGCFIFWIWKVTSVGGTIADGAYVAFTWAIPAVIAAIVVTRAIDREKVGRSPEHEKDILPRGKMRSMSCTSCGKVMRYSFSTSKWVCDRCQSSRDGPLPIRSDADDEGTTWTYHPPPERKPETGVGSEAWEANRAREIRELREEERKKAAEWRKNHADA